MTVHEAAEVSAAMREFLVWVAFRERTYADTMDAWGSHCPRFTLWEDALDQALIVAEAGLPHSSRVCLTERGRASVALADDRAATRHLLGPRM